VKNKAFTLVEILIVVIILGILAAIVIPQFTEASTDARVSALQSDLQTVRSQLELYKVQHLENYPQQIAAVGNSSANVIAQLTSRTNAAGTVGTDATLFPFGPYLQQFPGNSFVSDGTKSGLITFGTTDPAPGDGSSGWYLNTSTGKFSANDNNPGDTAF
jgi:general secretion pathway protein G